MFKRVRALAVAAVVVVGLAGCALVEPNTSKEPLTGVAACALGKTWTLDMSTVASALQAELGGDAIVTAEGTQKMQWDVDGSVTIDADYVVTTTATSAAGRDLTSTTTRSGRSSGISYINGDLAIPRDWDVSDLDVTSEKTINGEPTEKNILVLPSTDLDDKVGVELTCDGGTLTTHPRGGPITFTWTS